MEKTYSPPLSRCNSSPFVIVRSNTQIFAEKFGSCLRIIRLEKNGTVFAEHFCTHGFMGSHMRSSIIVTALAAFMSLLLISCAGDDALTAIGGPSDFSPNSKRESFIINNAQATRSSNILFVVDNSGSMGENIDAVERRIGEFIDHLVEQQVVFTLRVTTTDPNLAGMLLSSWDGSIEVRNSDPRAADKVREMLGFMPFPGSSNEMGIHNAMMAVQHMHVSSALSVVIFSDENDHSPLSIASYSTEFRALGKVTFFPFVKTAQSACPLYSFDESYGTRYVDVANAFSQNGSKVYDLCKIESTFPELAYQISRLNICVTLTSSVTKILNLTLDHKKLDASHYSLNEDKHTLCLSGALNISNGSTVNVEYEI